MDTIYFKGTAKAVGRSLRLYHGDSARRAAMDQFYRPFLGRGDLAFDIGAHVGDRVSSFRRLGARVVALEPQPGPARAIRLIHGHDAEVTLVEACCGERCGSAILRINRENPTVSTVSDAFVSAAAHAIEWVQEHWDHELQVPCTTLDALVAKYGLPRFMKIDVEGLEAEVLAGLNQAVEALSFEFTTLQPQVSETCVATLDRLGSYRFNLVPGESLSFSLPKPVGSEQLLAELRKLDPSANSGDVYAWRAT